MTYSIGFFLLISLLLSHMIGAAGLSGRAIEEETRVCLKQGFQVAKGWKS
jgi:hypothetical protein